jgi:hypothetical protein
MAQQQNPEEKPTAKRVSKGDDQEGPIEQETQHDQKQASMKGGGVSPVAKERAEREE